jgi:hypothetical protein
MSTALQKQASKDCKDPKDSKDSKRSLEYHTGFITRYSPLTGLYCQDRINRLNERELSSLRTHYGKKKGMGLSILFQAARQLCENDHCGSRTIEHHMFADPRLEAARLYLHLQAHYEECVKFEKEEGFFEKEMSPDPHDIESNMKRTIKEAPLNQEYLQKIIGPEVSETLLPMALRLREQMQREATAERERARQHEAFYRQRCMCCDPEAASKF